MNVTQIKTRPDDYLSSNEDDYLLAKRVPAKLKNQTTRFPTQMSSSHPLDKNRDDLSPESKTSKQFRLTHEQPSKSQNPNSLKEFMHVNRGSHSDQQGIRSNLPIIPRKSTRPTADTNGPEAATDWQYDRRQRGVSSRAI